MRKILFTLAVIASPLTAVAQTPVPLGSHASEQSVQAAVDLLANNNCGKGAKAMVRAVYECYQKTDENSPDIDICILADIATSNDANNKRRRSEALGDPNPYEDIHFVNRNTYFKRLSHFRASPRFDKLKSNPYNFNNYFKNTKNNVTDLVNAKCKSMGY